MNKFYLIPIAIGSDLYIKNKSLVEILKTTYPELYEAEIERIKILYSVSPVEEMPKYVKDKYNKHISDTKMLYEESGVPYYLIAYGKDTNAKELITKQQIIPEYPGALGVRSVSKKEAEQYYIETNYQEKVLKFFKEVNNKEKTRIRIKKG